MQNRRDVYSVWKMKWKKRWPECVLCIARTHQHNSIPILMDIFGFFSFLWFKSIGNICSDWSWKIEEKNQCNTIKCLSVFVRVFLLRVKYTTKFTLWKCACRMWTANKWTNKNWKNSLDDKKRKTAKKKKERKNARETLRQRQSVCNDDCTDWWTEDRTKR